MDRYSIIIPAFNSSKTIGRCIDSILNSEFSEEYELIVVDDTSEDNTAEMAKKKGARVIRLKKNRGPSGARNSGAKAAHHDTLIFIDSDIVLFSDTLQKIHRFMQDTQYAAVSCNFHPLCEMKDAISRYKHMYMCYLLSKQPRIIAWTFTSTFAIRKDVFLDVGGFNEKVRVNEDDLLGKHLNEKGYRIALAKHIKVKHLHKYSLRRFIREEFTRSRTLAIMKLSDIIHGTGSMKQNNSQNMVLSILLLPFMLVGAIFAYFNIIFILIPLVLFFYINFSFLRYSSRFGSKFLLKANVLILFDSFICSIGIASGITDYIFGRRI